MYGVGSDFRMKTDILYLNDQFEVEQGSSSEKGPMGWPFLVSYNFFRKIPSHLGERRAVKMQSLDARSHGA